MFLFPLALMSAGLLLSSGVAAQTLSFLPPLDVESKYQGSFSHAWEKVSITVIAGKTPLSQKEKTQIQNSATAQLSQVSRFPLTSTLIAHQTKGQPMQLDYRAVWKHPVKTIQIDAYTLLPPLAFWPVGARVSIPELGAAGWDAGEILAPFFNLDIKTHLTDLYKEKLVLNKEIKNTLDIDVPLRIPLDLYIQTKLDYTIKHIKDGQHIKSNRTYRAKPVKSKLSEPRVGEVETKELVGTEINVFKIDGQLLETRNEARMPFTFRILHPQGYTLQGSAIFVQQKVQKLVR